MTDNVVEKLAPFANSQRSESLEKLGFTAVVKVMISEQHVLLIKDYLGIPMLAKH